MRRLKKAARRVWPVHDFPLGTRSWIDLLLKAILHPVEEQHMEVDVELEHRHNPLEPQHCGDF
jgi:hypothetical protein